MSRILKNCTSLIGTFLIAMSLCAADFTISGKVSLIIEEVPLPFYEVSVADGEGKYVETVTTGFNGGYSVTFDIPEEEKVSFEVAVIDRCTGESIIQAIEKEGQEKKANFIVCAKETGEDSEECEADFDPTVEGKTAYFSDLSEGNISSWDWDFGDGNKSEEPSPTHIYEGGGVYFVTLTVKGENCEDSKRKPVIILPNEIEDCICDAEYDPVCVVLDNGQTIPFSNDCLAMCAGFTEYEACESTNPSDTSCYCPEYYHPVCVILEDSTQVEFSNECFAKCEGYVDFFYCGEAPPLDCDLLNINLPVCVTTADGEQTEFPDPCMAIEAGFAINQLEFCGEIPLDCEGLGIDFLPVCVLSSTNEQIVFLNPCEALTAGYSIGQLKFCDGLIGEGSPFDCEALGIDIPVCATTSDGEQLEFSNPCEAFSAGYSISQLEFCEGLTGVDSLFDCEALGIDIPVCATTSDGEQLEFSNPCEAFSAGYSIGQLEFCEGLTGVDSLFDCEALGIDIPVCATTSDGEQLEFSNPCEAFSAGYSIGQLEFCEGLTGVDSLFDCEALGIDIPVCATTSDGEQLEFSNPCEAFSAGYSISQLEFCEGIFGGGEFPEESAICQAFFFFNQAENDAMTIEFHDLSFGNVTEWNWDFGDGHTANGSEVVHTYAEPGLYEVTLTISGQDCESSFTMLVFNDFNAWYDAECQALFVPLIEGKKVKFWEISQGNVSEWSWDFGDGQTSTDSGPIHVYEELGVYTVRLSIITKDGCTSDFELEIDLGDGFNSGGIMANVAKLFGLTDAPEPDLIIQAMELYPNPVNNQLTLNLQFVQATNFELRIQSMNGNAIYRQKFNALGGFNEKSINVSKLAAGIYFAQIITENGVKAMKFVKK